MLHVKEPLTEQESYLIYLRNCIKSGFTAEEIKKLIDSKLNKLKTFEKIETTQ